MHDKGNANTFDCTRVVVSKQGGGGGGGELKGTKPIFTGKIHIQVSMSISQVLSHGIGEQPG